ncbi:MAG: SMC-Scp complex subunit ScpB [Lachnospiraceae bacterium]|nr:SMC-Scp complex subunit ScpB [Lachnospiraceae bacterium]
MEIKKYEAIIESILFTMGDAVEVDKIAYAIGHDVETTRKLINNLKDKYDAEERGINIIEIENSYQMCTKTDMYEYLIKVASQPKKHVLTDVLLETLSIIAYKQPITRMEVEKIRGVKCDHAVNKLIEYNLVTEVGRLDAPGRPLLFGTTEDFLRKFGVKSIDDLPEINSDKVAEFESEAEQEVQLKLEV